MGRTLTLSSRRAAGRGLALVTLAAALAATTGAGAAPSEVQLVLNGHQPKNENEALVDDLHRGTFTGTPPLCPSGTWAGTGSKVGYANQLTCDDGSGEFLLLTRGDQELDGVGTWSIASGKGKYTTLHGKGTWTNTVVPDPSVIVRFTSQLQGVVVFDGVPPATRITQATATRVGTSKRLFRVVVAFASADDVTGNSVSYTLSVKDAAGQLATRKGTAGTGLVRLSLLVKIRPSTRRLHVVVSAADPWGNSRSVSHPVAGRIG